MPIGWTNPYAFEIGGGSSDVELIWQALRDVVGKGGAGEIDTIEDLWRQAKARVIAFSSASMERAALQVFPDRATDWLPYYEALLGIVPGATQTEDERREVAARRFARQLFADVQRLEAYLQEIEPACVVLSIDHDKTDVGQHGRAFAARPYDGSYGSTAQATLFPNYSTEFVVTVRVTLASGVTTIPMQKQLDLARALGELLPAWVDFQVTQVGPSGAGFYADGGADGTSRADLTAVEP